MVTMTRSNPSTVPDPASTVPGPVTGSEAIRLQLRSWPEVEAYLAHCRGVIVPLGST